MTEVTFDKLAHDVATLLGESLSLECQSEESPFPGIKERVRILAPGILSNLLMNPEAATDLDSGIPLPDNLYLKLITQLTESVRCKV